MNVLVSAAHVLGWSVYLGGALCMELVLRHAQNHMKPSQVAIVCANAGQRYRWFSAVALCVLLITGILLVLDRPRGFDVSSVRGVAVWAMCGLWAAQVAILAVLSFRVHPTMHLRADATMTAAQIRIERARVGVAIRDMDRLLRAELALALLALAAGAFLHQLP
jgi:uncharacterized membrane protein